MMYITILVSLVMGAFLSYYINKKFKKPITNNKSEAIKNLCQLVIEINKHNYDLDYSNLLTKDKGKMKRSLTNLEKEFVECLDIIINK
jgi:hypothetical protein